MIQNGRIFDSLQKKIFLSFHVDGGGGWEGDGKLGVADCRNSKLNSKRPSISQRAYMMHNGTFFDSSKEVSFQLGYELCIHVFV